MCRPELQVALYTPIHTHQTSKPLPPSRKQKKTLLYSFSKHRRFSQIILIMAEVSVHACAIQIPLPHYLKITTLKYLGSNLFNCSSCSLSLSPPLSLSSLYTQQVEARKGFRLSSHIYTFYTLYTHPHTYSHANLKIGNWNRN